MFGPEMTAQLSSACSGDGEFMLAARFWTGGLRLESPSGVAGMRMENGAIEAGVPAPGADGVITLIAEDVVWSRLLSAPPPPFSNDIMGPIGAGAMKVRGGGLRFAQHYAAVARAIELLRPAGEGVQPCERREHGAFDAPLGRYIHLDIAGEDYRVYFEEAGEGVPVLLQHTAGAHGSQWRHLMECRAITDRFRLIAYDLPYHGKSLPPVHRRWWEQEYRLTGDFLRSMPVSLSKALRLERPVFMGCSVGGLLALDLALRHHDVFSAVIALEGALKIEGDRESYSGLWHPQVSSDYKARVENALMSPTSPEAYRKETSMLYSAGWPQAFYGDLWYYLDEFDLRERAAEIDASRIGVHIMSGEYDTSGTPALGRAAHEAIRGSTWTLMKNVGHFPMSENPAAFIEYLLPVLERVHADLEQPK